MEIKSIAQTRYYKTFVFVCCVAVFFFDSYGQTFPVECIRAGSSPEANATTLRSIAFSSDRFVAVGDGGIIVLSTNAMNWLRQPSPTSSTLYSLTYALGKFVAVGDAGCVLQSTNGSDWVSLNAGAANNFRSVAFGNRFYVALTSTGNILRSSDATFWELNTNALPNWHALNGIFFGGGLFIAYGLGGTILISSDGFNWTDRSVSTPSTFYAGTYGNGVFITAGRGEFGADQVARSTNGVDWTTSRQNMTYYAFCFGGGLLVGVGGGSAQWSSDGTTWSNTYIGAINCQSVAFGLGQYIAVGDGGAIYGSTNLTTWTQRNVAVCSIAFYCQGNGVSVGTSGNYGVIYSSEDQVHYIKRRDPGGFISSMAFGGDLFAAVGNVGILISNDGTNWTSATSPASGLVNVIMFEQNEWVAVGQNLIISSGNGSNWVLQVQTTDYLTGLIYGGEKFISFGWNGALWSSADGTNWINCHFPTSANFSSCVFQNGLYSIYAPVSYLQSPMGVVSKDGIKWFDASVSGNLLSLQSDKSLGSLTLTLAGEWGRNYLLRGSTNFSSWFDLQTITNLNGVTSVTITNMLNVPSVFFRTLAQ